jgi:hypothetical protein
MVWLHTLLIAGHRFDMHQIRGGIGYGFLVGADQFEAFDYSLRPLPAL